MSLFDYDPRNHPKKTQTAMAAIMAVSLIWCLTANMGSSLPELIFIDMPIHLGIAAFACILLMTLNNLMAKRSGRNAAVKLENAFTQYGFCTEVADILNRKLPEPSESDRVLRAFDLVMAEQYPLAKEQISEIAADILPTRQRAMLLTTKMLLHLYLGEFLKAYRLYEEHQSELERCYRNAPEYDGQFCAYADDLLEYRMVCAVFCELMKQPEQAAEYREQACLRAENRSPGEALFYRSLTELQRLYAAGESDAAKAQEAALQQKAASLNKPVTAGAIINLQRAVRRAKLCTPERLGVKQYMTAGRSLRQTHDAPNTIPGL
ncbi:MAG: hypothetical protein IKI58_05000 [Oscillospiraceae bacterium]|nr:hypothetical protein [Oscillospiraceae bacterium]